MSTLYRANVTRVETDGVTVEIPELGVGSEYGPCPLLNVQTVNVGDIVLVGNLIDIPEEMVVFGVLLDDPADAPTDPPTPPANIRGIYEYENEAARTADADLPLVSGTGTWLDDEQRLDFYTDEGTPGWVQYYGIRSSFLVLPQTTKIGLGVAAPTASLEFAAVATSDVFLSTYVAGQAFPRFSLTTGATLSFGNGAGVADASLSRPNADGLRILPRLGIGAVGDGVSRLKLANSIATERGITIENTAASQTGHHLYIVSASGNASAPSLAQHVTGDANDRFTLAMDGGLRWGPGTTATDTNLYRDGAAALRTGGKFRADGNLEVGFDATIGSDLTVTDISTLNGAVVMGTTATIADTLKVGPLQRDMGRGVMGGESLTTQGGTITTTETVVITGQTHTFKANRAYRLFVEGKVRYVTASSRPRFRIRKTNNVGAVLIDFGEYPVVTAPAVNVEYPVSWTATFGIGASDVVGVVLVLTLVCATGSAAFTGVGGPSRAVFPEDVGLAADYVNTGGGLPILT
jgi:hypothetical protein